MNVFGNCHLPSVVSAPANNIKHPELDSAPDVAGRLIDTFCPPQPSFSEAVKAEVANVRDEAEIDAVIQGAYLEGLSLSAIKAKSKISDSFRVMEAIQQLPAEEINRGLV